MKILNLTINEIYKQFGKISFVVCICLIILISISYPIISEYTKGYEENVLISDAVPIIQNQIDRKIEEAKKDSNYEIYGQEFLQLANEYKNIIKVYETIKNRYYYIKYSYVNESIHMEFINRYIEKIKENDSIKNNPLIQNYLLNFSVDKDFENKFIGSNNSGDSLMNSINSFSLENLEEIYNASKEVIKHNEKIIVDDDYNLIVDDLILEHEKRIEIAKNNLLNEQQKYDETKRNARDLEVAKGELEDIEYIVDTLKELAKDDVSDSKYIFVFQYLDDLYALRDSITLIRYIEPEEEYIGIDYEEYVRDRKSTNEKAMKEVEKLRYAIINQIDYKKVGVRDLIYNLINVSILITFMVIAIGGSIVSNEFNSGTIRLLLTKSSKRWKILLSKLLTIIFYSVLYMVLFMLCGFITSIILLGTSDLSIPMVEYISGNVVETSFIIYTLKNILLVLSGVIFGGIFAFILSTIILNTAFSVAFPIVIYYGYSVIITLMSESVLCKLLVYTPIPYMNLNTYRVVDTLLSTESLLKSNLSIGFGLLMLIIHAIILVIISFMVFIKRDVKN